MISLDRWVASFAVVALLSLLAIIGMRESPVDTNNVETKSAVTSRLSLQSPQSEMSELRAADLRSALRDLCADSVNESPDDNWKPEDAEAQIEAWNELKRQLANRLSASPSAEHLHLAALLDSGSASRVELIDRAVSLNPDDAFVLWGAVHICAEEREATDCSLRDWDQRLLEIDGQNSESWIRIAANRYQEDDTDAALDALHRAAASAETRAYWTETLEMIERGFAAGTDFAFPERVGMAFGLAASDQPNYRDYVTMCREQSAKSVQWAYACLTYGELVENQGKTNMGVSIAFTIQKLALEALGDMEMLTAVDRRQKTYRQAMQESVGNNYEVTERLFISNPSMFSAYLAAVRTHGESRARVRLAEETSRLLQQQPELACVP